MGGFVGNVNSKEHVIHCLHLFVFQPSCCWWPYSTASSAKTMITNKARRLDNITTTQKTTRRAGVTDVLRQWRVIWYTTSVPTTIGLICTPPAETIGLMSKRQLACWYPRQLSRCPHDDWTDDTYTTTGRMVTTRQNRQWRHSQKNEVCVHDETEHVLTTTRRHWAMGSCFHDSHTMNVSPSQTHAYVWKWWNSRASIVLPWTQAPFHSLGSGY